MKRIFFKSGFSTFAFILAIVASFAFSPANEEAAISYYIQQTYPTFACVEIDNVDCSTSGFFICSIIEYGALVDVYGRTLDQTVCFIPLFRSDF